jgi:hypothetical protein
MITTQSQRPKTTTATNIEELILRGPPTVVFFWFPRNLSNHMDRQVPTRDTMLVKRREITGKSQTLPWWLRRGEGVKTTA